MKVLELSLRVGLVLAVAVALGPSLARAHGVAPLTIDLRSAGVGANADYIFVTDGGNCPAHITATSLNPGLVQVFALNMTTGNLIPGNGVSATVNDRVTQVFVVVPVGSVVAPASTQVEICWLGSDPANGCDEDNCGMGFPTNVTVNVLPFALSTGGRLSSGIVRDPIAAETGELVLAERPDLALGGPLPLGFQRWYGSHLAADGSGPGALGPNWAHNFEWSFALRGHALEFTTPTGRVIRFENTFFAPSTWALAGQSDVPYELHEQGSERLLFDPFEQVVRRFDSGGRLIEVRDSNGNAHMLTYGGGELTQVGDGLGRTLTFAYSTTSDLASVTDGTRTVAFTYDANNRLATVLDVLGNTTNYAYDATFPAEARLTAKTLPEGNVRFAQIFDGAGRVQTQTDAGGNPTQLAYDGQTGDTTITDAQGGVTVQRHSTLGELGSVTDENGHVASAQYDSKMRRTAVTDRLGRTSSWTYHASGRIERIVEPDGRQTLFGYSSRTTNGFVHWDLTSLTRADGSTESFVVDAAGNVTARTDANGGTWAWTYDAQGNVLTATNPNGAVTTLTYNADGTLATSTDDDGNVTSYAYDALRRMATVTLPDTNTRTYAYDAFDRVTMVTDELGNSGTLGYDRNGNLTTILGLDGQTWTQAFDTMDRLTTITDPLGTSMSTTYDTLGRPATVTDAAGNTLTYGYDALGRWNQTTDDLGHTWSRSFDREERLTSRTNPLGNTVVVTVDLLGRPTRITSPLGNSVNVGFDALGRPITSTAPNGSTTSVARGFGERVQSLSIPGATTSYQYDAMGNVVGVTDPGGNTWTLGWDDRGRRTSRTDPLGNTTTVQYDARGRPAGMVLPAALGSATLTYDAAGRLLQRAYTDGTQIDMQRDAVGHLAGGTALVLARDGAGRLTGSNGIAVGRDAAGRIATLTLSAGRTITYTYDQRNLLASVTDWLGGVTTFTHDAASRLTSVVRPNGLTTDYEYDADDRLVRVHDSGPGGTLADAQLVRDRAGNVVQADRTLPTDGLPALGSCQYAYDPASRIVSQTDDMQIATPFTHDALGRLTQDGVRTLGWDLASRLTGVTQGGSTTTFTHDALGHVVTRSAGGQTDTWVVNHALGLGSPAIVRRAGNDVRYYVHTPAGQVLYSIEAVGNARHHHHFDEAGNLVFLSDDAGAITDAFHFAPFGVALARTGTFPTLYTWCGRFGVIDEGNGLFLMRARVYDAASGRFLSPDPIEDAGPRGTSPYPYAFGNPLAFVDPAGLTPQPNDVQVTVETRFVTVEDNFLDSIGIDHYAFGDAPPTVFEPSGGFRDGIVEPGDAGPRRALTLTQAPQLTSLATSELVAVLGDSSSTAFIANPRVMTSNTGGARLSVGGSSRTAGFDPIELGRMTGAQVLGGTGLDALGARIGYAPQVDAEGRSLRVSQSVEPDVLAGAGATLPRNHSAQIAKLRSYYLPRTRFFRRLSGHVRPGIGSVHSVVDGGAVSVGGLLRETSESRSQISILGQIPGVGALFRNEIQSHSKRTLLVLVKATITGPQE